MKEVPLTWRLATKIYFRQINRANLITSMLLLAAWVVINTIAHFKGFPMSKIPQSPWFIPAIIFILFIHYVPVNIWVLIKQWYKPTKEGYRMALIEEGE